MNTKQQDVLADVIVDAIKKALEPRDARIAALEAELTLCLKDGEKWQQGKAYAPRDIAQWGGTIWRCTEAHVSGSEFGHAHWRMLVKNGREKQ